MKPLFAAAFAFTLVSSAEAMPVPQLQQQSSMIVTVAEESANVAFVGSGVMARCIYSNFTVSYEGKRISLEAGIYRSLFASWLEPVNASLAFAITFVTFWFLVLYVLYRKQIFFKV